MLNQPYQRYAMLWIFVSLSVLLSVQDSFAMPTIQAILKTPQPEKTEVLVGSDKITLVALVSGDTPKCEWEREGPGELEKSPSSDTVIMYLPPKTIEKESVPVIITVKVTDTHGEKATKSITLNIKTDQPQPSGKILDISGRWRTNRKGLEYMVTQFDNQQLIWAIPSGPSGAGRIEGENVYIMADNREIPWIVTEYDPGTGKPSQLKSNDPGFNDLILFKTRSVSRLLDISGKWQTNVPGLEYIITQQGTELTWTIPNGASGKGKIDGADLYLIDAIGREVHSYVDEDGYDANGRAIRIDSNDPVYGGIILSRQ